MPAAEQLPTPLSAGETNAVGRTLGLLGDEWSLLIVQQALQGASRYGDFLARLPISYAVLTGRLRTLTDDQMLDRRVYQSNPVRSEYVLTDRSRSLWPVLVSIWTWERRWADHRTDPLPAMHHQDCGQDFSSLLVCTACGVTVGDFDVRADWGPSGSWARSMPAVTTRRRSGDPGAGLFPQTMSVFGNRWSAALLFAAALGTTRFGEFTERLGAPPASIAERLKVFRANGILTGDGEYVLTEKGQAFVPVLITALQWAHKWFHAPEGDALVLTHGHCGQPLVGRLDCDRCHRPLTGPQIRPVSP